MFRSPDHPITRSPDHPITRSPDPGAGRLAPLNCKAASSFLRPPFSKCRAALSFLRSASRKSAPSGPSRLFTSSLIRRDQGLVTPPQPSGRFTSPLSNAPQALVNVDKASGPFTWTFIRPPQAPGPFTSPLSNVDKGLSKPSGSPCKRSGGLSKASEGPGRPHKSLVNRALSLVAQPLSYSESTC